MLVNDCMTRHPIMISPSAKAAEAQKIMSENKIRHLPVVGSGKRLKGLITRQRLALKPDLLGSLNVWEISRYLADLTVDKMMLKMPSVVTITSDRTVERAARMMTENKIGCLPVIEANVVVGIITETDLLQAFQEMLGLPMPGLRVTVRMPDRPGEFAKLMSHVAAQQWGVMGIASFPSRREPGSYDLVLKIVRVVREEAEQVLSQIPDQTLVDIRDVV